MKAFEKWLKEKGYDLYRHTNDSWELGISTGVEEGWKAALLWFYKVAEHLSPTDCDILNKELDVEPKGKIIYMDTENGDDSKDGSNWKNAVKTQDAVSRLVDASPGGIIIKEGV